MKFPIGREYLYTTNNNIKILCLIQELAKPDDEPIFTLRDQKDGYESLQILFINLTVNDPTEATFAETVFGDVYYWLAARENSRLKPYLDQWRKVATIKRKRMAYEAIVSEVETRGRNAFSAAKFLIDEPEKDKRKSKVKEDVESTKKAAKDLALYDEDYDRIKGILDEQKSYPN